MLTRFDRRMTVLQASLFMGSEIQQTVLTMVHTSMGRIMSNRYQASCHHYLAYAQCTYKLFEVID